MTTDAWSTIPERRAERLCRINLQVSCAVARAIIVVSGGIGLLELTNIASLRVQTIATISNLPATNYKLQLSTICSRQLQPLCVKSLNLCDVRKKPMPTATKRVSLSACSPGPVHVHVRLSTRLTSAATLCSTSQHCVY